MPSDIITMLTGVFSCARFRSSASIACSVARARALASSSKRARVGFDLVSAGLETRAGQPAHSRSTACWNVPGSLLSSAHASLMLTRVMPRRLLAAPVTLIKASMTRLRSAVNSTLPTPVGIRARPTMSPGARRSKRVCAVRRMAARGADAQAALVDHEQQQPAGGLASFEVDADSRGVDGWHSPASSR